MKAELVKLAKALGLIVLFAAMIFAVLYTFVEYGLKGYGGY